MAHLLIGPAARDHPTVALGTRSWAQAQAAYCKWDLVPPFGACGSQLGHVIPPAHTPNPASVPGPRHQRYSDGALRGGAYRTHARLRSVTESHTLSSTPRPTPRRPARLPGRLAS